MVLADLAAYPFQTSRIMFYQCPSATNREDFCLGLMYSAQFDGGPIVTPPPHVPTTTRATRIAHASLRLSIGDEEAFDINAAVTALNAAVEAEDYAEAARLKALIADQTPAASSWPQDDTLPTWLLERLEGLSFRYPTPVQSAAMKCARDAVISAPTGAGKTVAFLTPLLCKAATALEERSRATSEAVEQFALSPTDALMLR